MPALFKLDVEAGPQGRGVSLRLSDGHGSHLARRDLKLDDFGAADWDGVFDTQAHVRRMQSEDRPASTLLGALGDFLARDVLGPEIMRHLAAGEQQRTLLLRLADAADGPAAAFARVPWEMARVEGSARTLFQQNLVVRVVAGREEAGGVVTVPLGAEEAVRVLLVFAEAPGSPPLAMRLERERLLEMFFAEVFPGKNVEVDVLCHGVTRSRIREQVRARGGYHVVHWSGHGHHDLLEIGLDEGERGASRITGAELVGLFTGAGGFIPWVVFLSACYSGSLLSAKDWASLRAAMRGEEGEARPGYTGTALALLQAGVKQVVAMRYEVHDVYRRRLARRFYRYLLAGPAHHAADVALALARNELAADEKRAGEYHALDHATPVVLGAAQVQIVPRAKRSAQMDRREPRPQPILPSGGHDLDPPVGFVGRGEELTALARRWLGPKGAPIAVIHGLAGLGKTSIAGEAIHLWHTEFDYVLAFQARGGALSIEELYRRLDQRLALASKAYRERCAANEMEKVYMPRGQPLSGMEWEEALQGNLIEALRRERVLLVLDNFETNLAGEDGPEGRVSADPAWDRLLAVLVDRLRGCGSRVLVTSRHRLAALGRKEQAVRVGLGALPPGQAMLFFQNHRALSGLFHGDEKMERLARRILDVSRGHPLILARIADLAGGHVGPDGALTRAGYRLLREALTRIEGEGYEALPDVFAGVKSEEEQAREQAYLEDVAGGAVDWLIEQRTPEARWTLWAVTRAGEAAPVRMLEEVMAADAETLRACLEGLSGAGLLTREEGMLGVEMGFHPLVAERAAKWMEGHPEERGEQTESEIWKAYGEWYGVAFKAARDSGKPGARDLATEFGRRGIRYLVRTRAFASLGRFASEVVTGTRTPTLLGEMIADMRAAADEAPAGKVRWHLRTYLADALHNAGQPDQALPLYAQAVEEAEAAKHWPDVGWICQNWAGALQVFGKLEQARETYLRSAEVERLAGSPRLPILGSELEALRVDVKRGLATEALPTIEEKLTEIRSLWARRQSGEDIQEAPDAESLARTLVSGLNIAFQANLNLERWRACLDVLSEIEQVERSRGESKHKIASTRFNQYGPLMKLDQLDKAKAVIEGCLDDFREAGYIPDEALALSALANVWKELKDSARAIELERQALAAFERFAAPEDRAISHGNLANYLYNAGFTTEAKDHRLAALIYLLIIDHGLCTWQHNLAVDIREAASRGERYDLPRLTDLLAQPAFAPLRTFVTERGAPVEALQTAVDQIIEQIRAQISTP